MSSPRFPRFTFEKFQGSEPLLTTSMKSVGEVMAIGRTFAESLQKALRGLETGLSGLDEVPIPGVDPDGVVERDLVRAQLARPTPDRLLVVAQALRLGLNVDEVVAASQYDPWFVREIEKIVAVEATVRADGLPADAAGLRALKAMGFSDRRLADLSGRTEADVAALRRGLGVRPVFKRIDTCAGEFASDSWLQSICSSPGSVPV